jgi:hypothetical protein
MLNSELGNLNQRMIEEDEESKSKDFEMSDSE